MIGDPSPQKKDLRETSIPTKSMHQTYTPQKAPAAGGIPQNDGFFRKKGDFDYNYGKFWGIYVENFWWFSSFCQAKKTAPYSTVF